MIKTEILKKTFVVIAAYYEEKTIAQVLAGLHKEGYKNTIVVDDGSTDTTSLIARKHGAIVLKHIINRGQGAALQTGISYALNHGATMIITFDADGQHQASDLPNVLQPIIDGNADVCLGSRFRNGQSNVPLFRKLLLKLGVLLMRVMYGIRLTDSHNGLRAFSRNAAAQLHITADRMEHASEILEQIMRHKLRYLEIPVTIKYTPYSLHHGQSSWNAVNIAFQMLKNKLLR